MTPADIFRDSLLSWRMTRSGRIIEVSLVLDGHRILPPLLYYLAWPVLFFGPVSVAV